MMQSSVARTLPELFSGSAASLSWFADDLSPAAAWPAPPADPSGWCVLGADAVREHVHTLAAGLIAAGVEPGDRVALMMGNRPEHWMTDQAVLQAGAATSTFYPTLAPEQVRSQAEHARISTVVVEGPVQLEQWSSCFELPSLRRVIVLDEGVPAASPGVAQQTYAETLGQGARLLAREPDVVAARIRRIVPDDMATIIFTSGTTAAPKAVPLTHRNVLADTYGLEAVGNVPRPYRTVSYLPTAHILDRLVTMYMVVLMSGEVSFSPNPQSFDRVVARSRPTSLAGVPRMWEKVLGALDRVSQAGPGKNPLAVAGIDQVALATAAGAPMARDVAEGLRSYGLPLVDMWGLTEAGGVITSSPVAEFRTGTVGRAIPGAELRVAEDGELLLRGPQVCPGYLQPDDMLIPIAGADGWLATGDVGSIDADGNVRITDRKKEIIITSGGKNVSPVAVEVLLTRFPLIAQALAVGSGHPYLVALLTLDAEMTRDWLRELHAIDPTGFTDEELAGHPLVRAELSRAVDRANGELSRAEQVKRWEVLAEPWSSATGTLTPTLKLRRSVIEQRHRDTIESLYETLSEPNTTEASRERR